jgi:hypothetical protein
VTLEEAIEKFKVEYAWLEDPAEADGKCGAKAYTFIRFLADNDVPEYSEAKMVDYAACTARHHPLKPSILTLAEDRHIEDYSHREIGEWTGHTVVKIGRLRIDWTARQFDEKSPFPLIWRTKS